MSAIEEIRKVFLPAGNENLDEKYTTLDFEYMTQADLLSVLREESIQILFAQLEKKTGSDSWFLSISDEISDPIFLSSSEHILDRFLSDIHDLADYTESDYLNLKFHVEKEKLSGVINIYSIEDFSRFISNISTIQFLDIINEDLKEKSVIHFNLLTNDNINFYSRNLRFENADSALTPSINSLDSFEIKSREACYFANQSKYPFSPFHFSLIKKSSAPVEIVNKLTKLAFIFSLVNIFDVTSIQDGLLHYKLNGYKSIEGIFDIDNDEIDVVSMKTYLSISEWIYSDSSNVIEKIGISRNILSIYLKESSLAISENAFYSIKSGFKVYLQENLNRYLEIRSTINEQLINISQNANNSIEKYLDDYQKSSITFVSFFISTLVITVLSSGQFQNVFTKDATILALTLIAISLLYLIFSLWNLNSEKERLKIRYRNLKGRFRDLLVDEDIDRILQENKEFDDEIRFIESRSKAYTILWLGTVLFVLVAILSLSSYINWNTLVSLLKHIP